MTFVALAVALVTSTILQVVLSIDNIVFISIVTAKLPLDKQPRVQRIGLGAGMLTRILMLFSLSWIMSMTHPIATLLGHVFSVRDFILMAGGLYILYSSVTEVHNQVSGDEKEHKGKASVSVFGSLFQIIVLDIVFSIDSVVTAVGMADQLGIMIASILLSVLVMMFGASYIGNYVQKHPTVKVLALSFLMLIGIVLVADGLGQHIERGYIYFSMAFSFFVEMLNTRMRRKSNKR